MTLYRWYLACDVCLLAFFIVMAIVWGQAHWIIAVIGAYAFGRDTGHEKTEAAFYERRERP